MNMYIFPNEISDEDSDNELTESMQIFNTGGNSSKNGQIGEIFASEIFSKRNPDIEYTEQYYDKSLAQSYLLEHQQP